MTGPLCLMKQMPRMLKALAILLLERLHQYAILAPETTTHLNVPGGLLWQVGLRGN